MFHDFLKVDPQTKLEELEGIDTQQADQLAPLSTRLQLACYVPMHLANYCIEACCQQIIHACIKENQVQLVLQLCVQR